MRSFRFASLLSLSSILISLVQLSPSFASTIYTFSNATATGKNGPTQAQINAAYSGTNLAGIVTVTASGIQKFTIPTTGITWDEGATVLSKVLAAEYAVNPIQK